MKEKGISVRNTNLRNIINDIDLLFEFSGNDYFKLSVDRN